MFGSKLKSARLKRNLTLEQVANQLNTTHATISRYENDKLQPSLEMLRDLCNLYKVSADWILGTIFG